MDDNIKAKPKKRLFIDILTQDVTITACILDLIDNSYDAYVRNELKDRREIRLTISDDLFEIFDNCGGIDKSFLKENVFKFGNFNQDGKSQTLGMYGIGLKRSVFKLGDQILLETDDGSNHCTMDLPVLIWEENEDNWDIPFKYEKSKLTGKPYTTIKVTKLHEEVKKKFNLVSFQNELEQIIQKYYSLILQEKIDFYFNDKKIATKEIKIPYSNEYSPSINENLHRSRRKSRNVDKHRAANHCALHLRRNVCLPCLAHNIFNRTRYR